MSLPLIQFPLRTSGVASHVRRLKWWLLAIVLAVLAIVARCRIEVTQTIRGVNPRG